MVEVTWSTAALDHIDRITAYIAQFDLVAADHISAQLLRLGNSLVEFPDRGRPANNGMRELVTARPYILRYRRRGNRVVIISVRHSAQQAS